MDNIKKILIIGTDSEISKYLSTFIPLLGNFAIEQAFDLTEALAKTNAFEPELIIYDLNLSGAEAKDVLREICAKHPKINLLVILKEKTEEARLRSENIRDILVKPFDLSDLSQKVKKLLSLDKEIPEQQ